MGRFVCNPANGLLTGSTLGNISTSQQYTAFGELASYVVKQGSSVLFSESYTRDTLGRISAKQLVDGTGSHTYAYDYQPSNGRLTAVRKDGTPIGSYQYDANGNRIQSGSKVASYDDQDRLSSYDGATYSYDVLGNLRQATLPDGTRIDYLIDGRNRRIGKQVNGATVQGWLYQGQLNPVAELDGNSQIVSRFVYGSRSNVPDYLIKGGQSYRIVTDQLGSVRLVIDSQSGTIAQRIDYDEYGIVTLDTHPGFQPFGFAGGLYDQHTKLIRFGARDYDALTGRWTAKDPIRFAGGDSNIYAYVGGNPVNAIDPLGLWTTGVYNKTTGVLTLHDLEKGTSISGKFESGGKPFGDPIPNGQFDIIERKGRDGFFRLEPLDKNYGDDTHDATGRDEFRLHHPGRTLGCVSAMDENNWQSIENFIKATASDSVTVQSKSKKPWAPDTESLTRFGRIVVIQ